MVYQEVSLAVNMYPDPYVHFFPSSLFSISSKNLPLQTGFSENAWLFRILIVRKGPAPAAGLVLFGSLCLTIQMTQVRILAWPSQVLKGKRSWLRVSSVACGGFFGDVVGGGWGLAKILV